MSYVVKIFNLLGFKKTLLKRSGGEELMCLDEKADLPTWEMSVDVNGDATESFRGQSVGEMELVLSNAGGTAQLYRLDVLHLLPGIGKEMHLCIYCLR